MLSRPLTYRPALAAIIALTVASCGGGKSPTPTQPSPTPVVTVTSVTVGIAGNASAALAPGEKLQLFAQAVKSDGSTIDVTNLAVWQSSNPVVATVAPTGVLTAASFGAVDVSATYQDRTGSLHADVQRPGCQATLSPESLTFSALGAFASVQVTTTLSDCRWTARSDAAWLSFSFDPGRSGSGGFGYAVPGNNNTDPRDANIVVTVVGGPTVLHRIHQERPVSCVYKVAPERASFSASGGSGSFQVTTIPGDCRWTVTESNLGVTVTGATAGTGAGTVTYSVTPNPGSSDIETHLEVRGLSGVNPPARHLIHISH